MATAGVMPGPVILYAHSDESLNQKKKRNFKGTSLTESQALKYRGVDVGGELTVMPKLLMWLFDHPYFTPSVYLYYDL